MAKKKSKRKTISKKIRMEVFKRDNFQCKYCGRKPPEVILHIDHIEPVAEGGDNNILNLITACFDCNIGKGKRRLDDTKVVDLQHEELKRLNEAREQMKMMLKWQKELVAVGDAKVEAVDELFKSLFKGFSLNEIGKKDIKKLSRKYGVEKVMEAIHIAYDQYAEVDTEGNVDKDSASLALSKLSGICYTNELPEHMKRIRYIRGILNNRLSYVNQQNAIDAMEYAYNCGVDLDWIQDLSKRTSSWSHFERTLYEVADNNSSDDKEVVETDNTIIGHVENSPSPVPITAVDEDEIYLADFLVEVHDFFVGQEGLTFRVGMSSSFLEDKPPKYNLPHHREIHKDNPSIVESIVESLGGYVLEFGRDYILDLPLNHPFVKRNLNIHDIKLEQFLLEIAEAREYTEVDDKDWNNEYLGEATLLQLSAGPIYLPCVISE